MAEKKRRGGGGKLARTENVQVRLDPKLRFAAELAAGKERRTLSSFIEWAVERAVKEVSVTVNSENEKAITAYDVAEDVWDIDESDRFVNIAWQYPGLLTYGEQKRWKFIFEKTEFWQVVQLGADDSKLGSGQGVISFSGQGEEFSAIRFELNRPLLRAAWELIDRHLAHGEVFDTEAFQALLKEYPPTAMPVAYNDHLRTISLLQYNLDFSQELALGKQPSLNVGGNNGA